MGQIDLTLKKLLSDGAPKFLEALRIPPRLCFLSGETFDSTELRMDVFALPMGMSTPYIHIELQTKNDASMPVRMMRYQANAALRLIKEKRHEPTMGCPAPDIHQFCLFVGNGRMRMASVVRSGLSIYKYRLIDARSIKADSLADSDHLSDVVLSVLCDQGGKPTNVDRILARLMEESPRSRSGQFLNLLVLSRVRGIYDAVSKRSREMGIVVDLASVPEFADASADLSRRAYRRGELDMALSLVRQRLDDDGVVLELERQLSDMDPAAMTSFVSRLLDSGSPNDIIGIIRPHSAVLRP